MSGLSRRLCRPEATRGRNACPECGSCPGVDEEYEVVWFDHEDDEVEPDEFCETCSSQLTFTVTWHDLEPEQPGGGG